MGDKAFPRVYIPEDEYGDPEIWRKEMEELSAVLTVDANRKKVAKSLRDCQIEGVTMLKGLGNGKWRIMFHSKKKKEEGLKKQIVVAEKVAEWGVSGTQ